MGELRPSDDIHIENTSLGVLISQGKFDILTSQCSSGVGIGRRFKSGASISKKLFF